MMNERLQQLALEMASIRIEIADLELDIKKMESVLRCKRNLMCNKENDFKYAMLCLENKND